MKVAGCGVMLSWRLRETQGQSLRSVLLVDWPALTKVWPAEAAERATAHPSSLQDGSWFLNVSRRTKLYVTAALAERETARRYRRLKRKYPDPKHAEALE